MRLILASTSKYRRELLARLQLPFMTVSPDYDEPTLDLAHEEVALAHAVAKAQSLADGYPDDLIIGSDQLVSFEGKILGKPGTVEKTVEQLMRLQGKTHRLITAVSVHQPRSHRTENALDFHQMTMRGLDEGTIRAYVERDRPFDCAGGYKLESLGLALFKSIQGEDDTAVMGLPLLKLIELLERFGIDPLRSKDTGLT